MKSEAITNNRLSYMDIAKGFGILCVIAGYMGNETINRFVFSFHMPLFFIISGYFVSERLSSFELLKKRVSQLIPPYIFTCFVVILLNTIKATVGLLAGTESIQDVFNVLVKWLYASLYGAGTNHQSPFRIALMGAVWFL
jgi:fucose 4-O-acetylase-like acetyltransferase